MKKIILVLLISFAFGQKLTQEYVPESQSLKDFAEHVDRVYEKMQYDNLQITRGMILDYAEECYNDSNWVAIKTSDELIWIHKKPTFKGFIEWIKK